MYFINVMINDFHPSSIFFSIPSSQRTSLQSSLLQFKKGIKTLHTRCYFSYSLYKEICRLPRYMFCGEILCQLKPPFHTSASLRRFSLAKEDNLSKTTSASNWNSELKKTKKQKLKVHKYRVIQKDKKNFVFLTQNSSGGCQGTKKN